MHGLNSVSPPCAPEGEIVSSFNGFTLAASASLFSQPAAHLHPRSPLFSVISPLFAMSLEIKQFTHPKQALPPRSLYLLFFHGGGKIWRMKE